MFRLSDLQCCDDFDWKIGKRIKYEEWLLYVVRGRLSNINSYPQLIIMHDACIGAFFWNFYKVNIGGGEVILYDPKKEIICMSAACTTRNTSPHTARLYPFRFMWNPQPSKEAGNDLVNLITIMLCEGNCLTNKTTDILFLAIIMCLMYPSRATNK